MDIAFESKTIREICEDEAMATAALGLSKSEALITVLADLRAAYNIHDLLIGTLNVLTHEEYQSVCQLTLSTGLVLSFGPNHERQPLDDQGNVNWSKITRIKILKIN